MSAYKTTAVLPECIPHDEQVGSIAAPSESAFTSKFGTLFPPAQYLTTQWGKTAYYSYPPEHKSSPESKIDRVLMIHGVGTPAMGLLPLTNRLRNEYSSTHFVLFDVWGHGLSSTPLAPHEPTLFHAQIIDLLDHLEWPSAHLVGYSFGGVTSMGLIASRPDLVKSVSLVAPAGLLRKADIAPEDQVYFKQGSYAEDDASEWAMGWLGDRPLNVPDDWREKFKHGTIVAEALRDWQQREHEGHAASVLGIVRTGGAFDQPESFRKAVATGVSMVGILGELDEVCSQDELKAVGITDVHVVQGAGHAVVRDKASEVASLIIEFWKNLE